MRHHLLLTVIAGAAVTLAACGSTDRASAGYGASPPVTTISTVAPATTPAPAQAQPVTTVRTAATGLGSVLVDTAGRTLYAFTKDANGTSTCTDACAMAWPPALVTGDVAVGDSLARDLFTAVDRPDGTKQLKVGKWPLYTFAGDANPGDTNGQGSGGSWFVVGTDGKLVKG